MNKSIVTFFIAFLVAIVLMAGITFFYNPEKYGRLFVPYYRDSAPDGWYHQKEGIGTYNYDKINGVVCFALCDHSYLGPLHGTFRVSDDLIAKGVFEGNESRQYDLYLENNIIVDAHPYN